MTDEELQAIRDRLESLSDNWSTFDAFHDHALTDIATLLSEVDRLQDELVRERTAIDAVKVHVANVNDRLKSERDEARTVLRETYEIIRDAQETHALMEMAEAEGLLARIAYACSLTLDEYLAGKVP